MGIHKKKQKAHQNGDLRIQRRQKIYKFCVEKRTIDTETNIGQLALPVCLMQTKSDSSKVLIILLAFHVMLK